MDGPNPSRDRPSLAEHLERFWTARVEEGVRRALQRLKVPRREELQELEARLQRVAERIERLEGRP